MKNKEKEIEKRKKHLNKIFDKLKKKSATIEREGWERFTTHKNGTVNIRCQALVKRDGGIKQCGNRVLKDMLVCRFHSGRNRMGKKNAAMNEIREKLGVYKLGREGALQKELKEIQDVDSEELDNVTSEIHLALALLRKYLKETSDEEISRKPGQLMWLIDNIVNFKKAQWEMKHAPKVSFSLEQVEYLFIKMRMVLIDVIKDSEMLKDISGKMKKLGVEIKEEGFRVIK